MDFLGGPAGPLKKCDFWGFWGFWPHNKPSSILPFFAISPKPDETVGFRRFCGFWPFLGVFGHFGPFLGPPRKVWPV